jgi:Tfp pilus assembly protein PilF
LEKAVGYYEGAVGIDPDYALAWAGLADALRTQAGRGYLPVDAGYGRARAAAERALALEPDLVEAHTAMGWIQLYYDGDWAGADASFQRALALEPGNANSMRGAAVLAGGWAG